MGSCNSASGTCVEVEGKDFYEVAVVVNGEDIVEDEGVDEGDALADVESAVDVIVEFAFIEF